MTLRDRKRQSKSPGAGDAAAASRKRELLRTLLAEGGFDPSRMPVVRRKSGSAPPPLSYVQEELWLHDQIHPGNIAFNVVIPVRFNGRLDATALERALNEIVRRHEILRTTFLNSGEQPVQIVADEFALPQPRVELQNLAAPKQEAEMHRLLAEELETPFDLGKGPLIRAKLLCLGPATHVLLIAIHHIIFDGPSVGVFFRELSALYDAFSSGRPSPLAPLPIQYADFALWQRQWLPRDGLHQQLAYWKRHLQDVSALHLPVRDARAVEPAHRAIIESLALPRESSDALKGLGRREGVTLFNVVLAAFEVLLHRCSGQDDIVVGTPVTLRRRPEFGELFGLFVNIVALRSDVSGERTFRELLGRVRETVMRGVENSDVPFSRVMQELGIHRGGRRNPLIQAVLNFGATAADELKFDGLHASLIRGSGTASRFDVEVYVNDAPDGLGVDFVCAADLFSRPMARQMLAHFRTLLESIVAKPDTRISELALLTEAEQATLAREEQSRRPRNAFEMFPEPERAGSLVSRFEAQVRAHGARLAVKTPESAWTYETLNARANGVAHALLAQREGRPGRIGLAFDQGAPMLAGMLGVLKSGQAYVPLDPSYPLARLQAVMADAGIEVVVTEPAHRELVAQLVKPGRLIDVMAQVAAPENPGVQINPHSLAYVLYTSGSTGAPKGVMQTHRNVLHHVGTYTNALHIGMEDGLTLLPAYGFDAAVQDIYGALLNGATVYPLDMRREARAGEVLERISAEKMTLLHCTPTVYRYLLLHRGTCDLSRVRAVVLGGEEARAADLELFKENFVPGAVFVNGLGPTESTLALQFFATHDTQLYGNVLPVGRPVAGTEVLLLNERGQPSGICGQIAIRSDYVTPGYWGRPELTQAAFLEGPAPGEPRVYRTGDLGRVLPDGQLVFMGRADRQIKLRGFRIELGDIESALVTHPQVGEAVAIASEDSSGDKRLVAYVSVLDEGANPAALREYLKQRLPDYMVPAQCVVLKSLPRLPNGKVDAKGLPAPQWEAGSSRVYLAPSTSVEEVLAGIWAEVLKLERVGVEDNFFDLGGHSLLAMQVISQVRDALDAELPLRDMFAAPTVKAQARLLETLIRIRGSGDGAGPAQGGEEFVV